MSVRERESENQRKRLYERGRERVVSHLIREGRWDVDVVGAPKRSCVSVRYGRRPRWL